MSLDLPGFEIPGVKEMVASTCAGTFALICNRPPLLAASAAAGVTFLNRGVHRLADPILPKNFFFRSAASYSISTLLIAAALKATRIAPISPLFFAPGGVAIVAICAYQIYKSYFQKPQWYSALAGNTLEDGQTANFARFNYMLHRSGDTIYVRPNASNSPRLSPPTRILIRSALQKSVPGAPVIFQNTQEDIAMLMRCISQRTPSNQVIQFAGHDIRIVINSPRGGVKTSDGQIIRTPFLVLGNAPPSNIQEYLLRLLEGSACTYAFDPTQFTHFSENLSWIRETLFPKDTFLRRLKMTLDADKPMNGLVEFGATTFRVIVNPTKTQLQLPNGDKIASQLVLAIDSTRDPEPSKACKEFNHVIENYFTSFPADFSSILECSTVEERQRAFEDIRSRKRVPEITHIQTQEPLELQYLLEVYKDQPLAFTEQEVCHQCEKKDRSHWDLHATLGELRAGRHYAQRASRVSMNEVQRRLDDLVARN